MAALMHPDYLQAKDMREVGKDIMVHRGLIDVYNGILENTRSSIDHAYRNGVRSIEADIQVTSDGVPVLFHDRTLGRMTDDPHNRLVSRTKWADIKDANLVLRNPVDGNFIETSEKIPSLKDLLQDIKDTKPGMSLVLDCKDGTGEAVFEVLKNHPEFRPFVAIKPYSKYYVGGFDQFLGNLYDKQGINPQSPEHQAQRDNTLALLKETKLVPIFSQVMLQDKQFQSLFADEKKASYNAEELAGMALKWLKNWGDSMDVKIIEAHSMGADTVEGKAMNILNELLAEKSNGLATAAMSGSYRYEDFSVPAKDGGRKYYTWGDSGEIYDKTDDLGAAVRETAGSLRHEADSILTDQLQAEAFAISNDITLPRGNTGVELDVEPGTQIDVSRNKALAEQRKKEYDSDLKKFDTEKYAQVRAGRKHETGTGAPAEKEDGMTWTVPAVAAGVVLAGGAAIMARQSGMRLTRVFPGRALKLAAQGTMHALANTVTAASQRLAAAGPDEAHTYEMV
jgi:hypothetical protein